MAETDSEETIMEQDQQKPDHLPDRPNHAEERLRSEKKQAERPGSQDECKSLIHELRAHQVELEIEKGALKKSLSELEAKVRLYSALFDFARTR
jgi:hypothetical protein